MRKLVYLVAICSIFSCVTKDPRPNVILIMADDMGSECLSINGATEYKTPNLDRLAKSGMRFTNAFSQPLCTPTRVKIMTGKYNYRNYDYFGYLNPNQRTFGNMMKEAGYATCISGKWQLNGLSFELPGHDDVTRPEHFGFDEHCLWQLSRPRKDGERYADPLIYKNGVELEGLEDSYGPDIFVEFIMEFIDKHKDEPFFIYYPMVLVHDPFVPTPDSPEWASNETRGEKDKRYFKDMMAYTDKIVGRIEKKLEEQGLDKNTLLIFTADNGTHYSITTQTVNGPYLGGKSFTTQRGIHVPFVASWPQQMSNPGDYAGVIDFSDFYPTLADIAGLDVSQEEIDGSSFLNVLKGDKSIDKGSAMIHYDPQWGRTSANRNRFALTDKYKLYRDGAFFGYRNDIDETTARDSLSMDEKEIKADLQKLLDAAETESAWIVDRDTK